MVTRPLQRGALLLILAISGLSAAPIFAHAETATTNQPVRIPAAIDTVVPNPPSPEPVAAQESLPLGAAPANVNSSASAAGGAAAASDSSWILQTITALGVVLALIVALRFVIQRVTGLRPAPMTTRLVEVLARSPIAPRTHLLFLRIHQRIVVATQSPAGMQTLTELTDPQEVAAIMAQVQAARPASISRSFQHLLGRLDRDYVPDEPADGAEPTVDRTRDEVNGLLARIRNLKDRSGQ